AGVTGERSHARDQGRAAERFRAPIDGVDFLRELRCRLQRRVQVAALLDPRHFLARRGGNGLLDADCTSGEKFSCGLRTRQRGQSVVAALVGEACELQICLVAPLCRGGVAAPDGKLRDREELLRRRGGVSRSERRQGPDLARVALGRIAGRNGTCERARQIELALRFGWKLLLRNSRRSGGRLGSGEAHLRRQLLVERFWTRNQGR